MGLVYFTWCPLAMWLNGLSPNVLTDMWTWMLTDWCLRMCMQSCRCGRQNVCILTPPKQIYLPFWIHWFIHAAYQRRSKDTKWHEIYFPHQTQNIATYRKASTIMRPCAYFILHTPSLEFYCNVKLYRLMSTMRPNFPSLHLAFQ